MTNYIQTNQFIQLPAPAAAASIAISSVDSGKIIGIPVLNGALGIYLPPLQAGLRYRFLVTLGVLGFQATITPFVAANIFYGGLINNNAGAGTFISKPGSPNVAFTMNATVGDYIELFCDGISWHAFGASRAAAGIA